MKKTKFLSLSLALLLTLSIALASAPTALAAEYDSAGATAFTFSDSKIAVAEGNYSGYQVSGTGLTINGAGTYVVSGSCSDGSITVKKGTTGVTLVLNGLTLTSADTAPIACNKSSGVTIVAPSGTTNTLTDAAYNNDDIYPDNLNAENAVIKCKDGSQVTICGSGVLNINSNGKNGIKSGATTEAEGEAWLTIRDVTLNIKTTVNDGINAEQLLTISSGKLTVDAADDGIHCDLVMDIGAARTAGPTINITNSYEGIEAANLNIYSGDITIHAQDDGMNAANADLTGYAFSLNIAGGTLTVVTASGDGIDSNGTLTISGGTVAVWSASTADNQPLDADGAISITGGTVLAAGGSAGMGLRLSAGQPYVTFGSGAMGGGMKGQHGQWSQPDGQTGIKPNWQMGVKPDGQIGMKPGGQMGTPPDGQMGTPPDGQTSGQSSASIVSGNSFKIQDASGNTVYSGTAACNASHVIFSSGDLISGSTYTLYSGSASIASAEAQTGPAGGGQMEPPDAQSGATIRQPESPVAPTAGTFIDVDPNAWYADAVRYAVSNGLMSGTGGNRFSLNGATTRAMVMTILARHAGMDTTGGNSWYEKGMSWSVKQGISDGSNPNASITREQFVTMLWRYAGSPDGSGDLSGFSDAGSVSSWAVSAMEWAVGAGIVEGSNGKLNPTNNATRAETAALLMRFCQNTTK